ACTDLIAQHEWTVHGQTGTRANLARVIIAVIIQTHIALIRFVAGYVYFKIGSAHFLARSYHWRYLDARLVGQNKSGALQGRRLNDRAGLQRTQEPLRISLQGFIALGAYFSVLAFDNLNMQPAARIFLRRNEGAGKRIALFPIVLGDLLGQTPQTG